MKHYGILQGKEQRQEWSLKVKPHGAMVHRHTTMYYKEQKQQRFATALSESLEAQMNLRINQAMDN